MEDPLPLCGASVEALGALMEGLGEPSWRGRQLHKQIYVRGVSDPSAMTDLSKALRERVAQRTVSGVPEIGEVRGAADGTRKLLYRFADGKVVEGVLIPMGEEGDPPVTKLTLCISTQVGCTLDCGFCLTGTMGLLRNLTAGEIVGQVMAARTVVGERERLGHYVYMGMGEPLANYRPVVDSLNLLSDPDGLSISGRRITVSTAGMANRIADFGRDTSALLAISLNASTNEQRDRLMPAVNRAFPLPRLLDACRAFPLAARRRITFEYVLLAGENDSDDDARRLVDLVRGLRVKMNLIPFNPHPALPYERPKAERTRAFQRILLDAALPTSIRSTRGDDVLAACGQLGVARATGADLEAATALQ